MQKTILGSGLTIACILFTARLTRAEQNEFSNFATSRNIVVIDEVVPGSTSFIDTNFNFDKNSGDAWVEATTVWNDSDPDTERAKVTNLSFNRALKQIIYDDNGRNIVCANIKGPSWTVPLGDTIEPTGHCELRGSIQDRNQDNGFGRETVSYLHVVMDLK